MKRYKPRPRGGDSIIELLRGKNKELLKIIKQLQQRIRQLEKQLNLKSSDIEGSYIKENKKQNNKTVICDSCGKGIMEEYTIQSPEKLLVFLTCKICKHRKKAK